MVHGPFCTFTESDPTVVQMSLSPWLLYYSSILNCPELTLRTVGFGGPTDLSFFLSK